MAYFSLIFEMFTNPSGLWKILSWNWLIWVLSAVIVYWFVHYSSTIETHGLGAVYLQGTRTPGSPYVDDGGRPIPFFRWDVGEPKQTGNYLRTDGVSRLQEVASGSYAYNYICSIYIYFWVVKWHYIFFLYSNISPFINDCSFVDLSKF